MPCYLCPRGCGAFREEGGAGFCGESYEIRASRAALHYWEEPCISGSAGSGAIFFSGCMLRCVYCQNREISRGGGFSVSADRLREIMFELKAQGAQNINLVTPSHFAPQLAEVLRGVCAEGLGLPIVYNTSAYETVDMLRALEGLVDIWLPDFKYLDTDRAGRYSKAPDYPEVAKAALQEMVRQCGRPEFDESGRMLRGVIVRHLVLPGGILEAKRVVRYLHETYGDSIYISILGQYTPRPGIERDYPELAGRLRRREYERVVDAALRYGVTQAFVQEAGCEKESFIPAFDGTGL